MDIYGVYVIYYVYEVAYFRDLVKVFANEQEATSFMDEMNKIVEEKSDKLSDAEWHCSECIREDGNLCTSCEYNSILDDDRIEITFANGDTEQLEIGMNYGDDPTFYIVKMKLN